MYTDLDRLHKVALSQFGGRQQGKTFLQCHRLAAAIELGAKHVICVVSYVRDIAYILPLIYKVFEDHDLPILKATHTRTLWKCGIDIFIEFVPQQKLEGRMCGIEAGIVYMRH